MSKTAGLIKGLFGAAVALVSLWGCKQGMEDPTSLVFKQKQADAYLEFLSAHPDSSGLRLLTAQKLDSVGRYKDALLQMDTLLKEDSTKYGLWVVRANILLDSTDTSGAVAAYGRALTRYQGEEALLAEGVIFALKNQDTCLKIAEQLSRNPVYSHYIKGLYAAHQLQRDEALPMLDKAIELDPAFAAGYATKAKLYLALSKPDSAKIAVLEGIRHNAHSIELLNTAGAVFEALLQKDSADRYYESSLRIKPYQPVIEQKITKQTQ
ncbi:hypothetical protein SAMN05192529_10430 [Arachidicoccus rhizosphaerae]|jgi:tetratricopeptide (TPR) repeat protein|uniref:Uncharacterized protein n=1 Tax=Arachidicoccus rhizosphaerae TaxID=551991 RepID=A0A1H3WVF6_9BACT|nr:hypothetical protein [Arachidicoccus rhizosphaerae]SDZ91145.1 hypothetical protein SAMN05192529_10430 [Arachidicoccus rhizosphaerae]